MASNKQQPEETPIVNTGELGVNREVLWQAADKLRGTIDAAEYKHVVLGLIFLKYISDAFEARRAKLTEELKADGIEGRRAEKLLESRDEYTAENVFWVPPEVALSGNSFHDCGGTMRWLANHAFHGRSDGQPLRQTGERKGLPICRNGGRRSWGSQCPRI